ncbi:DUF4166 domain-containing protein [uncultured Jannaschia sp.]|uniref:DUF4166 domain-containing protein n=1 Tax=uncultured Jannaschia sp. TaxID=293347 RepID=UPI00262681FC|nr:DUF4166 domain-containing protein [uncultured Jannaschia sp.]
MTGLIARGMGPAFDGLPAPLRALHGAGGLWRGTVTVETGRAVARRLALAIGLPSEAGTVPFSLEIQPDGTGEVWTRRFGPHVFRSYLGPGPDGTVLERIGALRVRMRPEPVPGGLHLRIVGAGLGAVIAPAWLAGRGGGMETVEGDGVRFDVSGRAPGLGRVIRYHGTLAPA